MYTIINKTTGQEIRTHDMFRCSAVFPNLELAENEQVAYIPEELIETINSAYECTITADEEGTATAITITKTLAEWQAEQPAVTPDPTIEEYLLDLDYRTSMLELGL